MFDNLLDWAILLVSMVLVLIVAAGLVWLVVLLVEGRL